MQIFSHKKQIKVGAKRFNPHLYWTVLLVLFVFALSLELIWFSWYFVETTRKLDEPAYPSLETNAVKIRNLERKLTQIDQAIQERTTDSVE